MKKRAFSPNENHQNLCIHFDSTLETRIDYRGMTLWGWRVRVGVRVSVRVRVKVRVRVRVRVRAKVRDRVKGEGEGYGEY
jgi:hypothetical protein